MTVRLSDYSRRMNWIQEFDFRDGWGAVATVLVILGAGYTFLTRRKIDRQAEGFQLSLHHSSTS